jgi:predicted enzyme related to lactoylglutathione lyase
MLLNKFSSVLIWSEKWRELANWYRDVLELPVESELNLPDDTGVNFKLGDTYIWIGFHDQVQGSSKDKFRIMVCFEVDSVSATYKALTAKGVRFIQESRLAPPQTFYVATALDPEDNIIQFESDNL